MRLTIYGALLFLFIPLVLVLYLRQPLGPGVSIALGLVIMFGHRFVAAPWMERHATERCLWCGRSVAGRANPVPALVVVSGGAERVMAACSAAHRDLVARFLTFLTRYRAPIAVGIFVPLVLLIVASLAAAAGRPFLPYTWSTWQFRMIVALTVVMVSVAYRGIGQPVSPLRSPFPLHNFFLLGIRNTLWVFRVVGAWWLVAGVVWMLR